MTSIPLGGASFDRAAHHRLDEDWLDRAFQNEDARVLLMKDGMPLIVGGQSGHGPRPVVWLGPQAAMLSDKAKRLFLGLDDRDAPVFALDLPKRFNLDASPIAGLGVFEEMRAALGGLDAFDANAAATARSIFEWHHRNGYCANCGAKTDIVEAGWKRECDNCGAEHFPRTDPVAIMLAVKDDQCLLGRQAGWPDGFFSCLAGFIEPGETFEDGAARELKEEAGVVAIGEAEYLFSQPWPFPSSLMIGMILEVESFDLVIDESEIETARWFTREEARSIMAGTHDEVFAPPPMAIAHHILKAWAERD